MQNYHNVSVRLTDDEYNKLLYLLEKYNRMSYGKVSIADVLRTTIKDSYIKELENENKPVALENIQQQEQQEKQIFLQQLEQHQKEQQLQDQKAIIKDELKEETQPTNDFNTNYVIETNTKEAEDVLHPVLDLSIDEQLKQLETTLQGELNTKGKPYSKQHIKQQVEKKRKELETEKSSV